MNTVAILLSAFVLSVVALLAFIWSQRRGLLDDGPEGARVIFAPGEEGRIEEPAAASQEAAALQRSVDAARGAVATAATQADLQQRAQADASSAPVVFSFCAVLSSGSWWRRPRGSPPRSSCTCRTGSRSKPGSASAASARFI